MMIDLVSLKDFLVLCHLKSFSRAAEQRHVSVSGLSRRIQNLELWIGAPVFLRCKGALELTSVGCQLQAVASEVVYALDGLRKSVKENGKDKQSRIRFAAPHVMSAVFFSDWIPRLHGDFKMAKFSVQSDSLQECFAMLNDGSSDYVVAFFDAADVVADRVGNALADYMNLELGRDRLIPVSAPDAAGRPLFNLSGSNQEPVSFLGYAEECHLGWSLAPKLEELGLVGLRQDHEASLTDGLRFMALSKLGVAWLPLTLVQADLAAKRLVRAGDGTFDVPLRLVLTRKPAPLATEAERLWEYLRARALLSPICQARVAGDLTNDGWQPEPRVSEFAEMERSSRT
ncbi:LysR substrate-binding domain-containing protein [Burkholderia sp. 22PA0106]|uniref:LysR substrate-binding domain-containing protein n=1 Tax=Burkholderia sp. 22PA0106 TaxID=3237371 RepID=UPI0039C37D55